jgi:hypothetical protein
VTRVFRRRRRPRLVHLEERREAGSIILRWDSRGGRALLWRVLRSEQGFAGGAFDHTVVGSGQSLVSEGALSGSRDAAIDPAATYCYTVFAEDERGEWHRVLKVKLAMDDRHLGASAEGDFEAAGSRPGSLDPHALDIAQSGGHPR